MTIEDMAENGHTHHAIDYIEFVVTDLEPEVSTGGPLVILYSDDYAIVPSVGNGPVIS